MATFLRLQENKKVRVSSQGLYILAHFISARDPLKTSTYLVCCADRNVRKKSFSCSTDDKYGNGKGIQFVLLECKITISSYSIFEKKIDERIGKAGSIYTKRRHCKLNFGLLCLSLYSSVQYLQHYLSGVPISSVVAVMKAWSTVRCSLRSFS